MPLQDDLRYQLLKALENGSILSQRQLAEKMGLSLGKTNYCIKALIEAGWVKVGNFAKSNTKIDYAYILTPKGLKEKSAVTLRFLKNKQMQYEQLEREIVELQKEALQLNKFD